MNLFEFEGKRPSVHPDAFVAPTATLIGDVTVEAGASIWYGVVVRADICTIVIKAGSNIQDNSVLHAAPGETLTIGPNATVGHGCVDPRPRRRRAGARRQRAAPCSTAPTVGAGTLVAAGSVVTPGVGDPGRASSPPASRARPTKPIEGTSSEFWVQTNGEYYRELARVTPPEHRGCAGSES